MSEKIELQSAGDDTSRTEQDDTTNDTQGTSPSTKAAAVTTSRWRKISFTVMTLLAYMFLNAGISMITPFFAIVVSFMRDHPGGRTSLVSRASRIFLYFRWEEREGRKVRQDTLT